MNNYQDIFEEVTEEAPYQYLGQEARYKCPLCGSEHQKFYLNLDSGLWICYNCDKSGNFISLLMQYYEIPFKEAKEIMESYDLGEEVLPEYVDTSLSFLDQLVQAQQGKPEEIEVIDKKIPPIPTGYQPLVEHMEDPVAFPYFAYLNSRGVTLEQIVTHRMGFVTAGSFVKQSGEVSTMFDSVVFLTLNKQGQPIYWNTRSIDPNPIVKTLNAPAQDDEYSRLEVVFNLNNVKATDNIILCEGVFNALTCTSGNNVGVATFGKRVTDTQLREIAETPNRGIYLFFDQDAYDLYAQIAYKLNDFGYPQEQIYYVLNATKGTDANDLGPEIAKGLIERALPVDYKTELLWETKVVPTFTGEN